VNRRTISYLTAAAATAAAALFLGAGSGGAASAAPAEGPVCLQINIVDAYDTGKLLCP
jgi:hypothetical protein